MARRLRKEMNVKLDAILSSPANRALSTARFFAEEFDVKKKNIIEWPELYDASVNKFYSAVEALNDDFNSVALFSHNPGITVFANSLMNVYIDDMPTCSVFALHIKTESWKDFETAEKEFWFFDYPKNVS